MGKVCYHEIERDMLTDDQDKLEITWSNIQKTYKASINNIVGRVCSSMQREKVLELLGKINLVKQYMYAYKAAGWNNNATRLKEI